MDFYVVKTKSVKNKDNEWIEISPDFIVGNSKDLMVRGGKFYAIWDEAAGVWSTNEYDVARLVDENLDAWAAKNFGPGEASVKHLRSFDSQSWVKFCKFVGTLANSFHPLDESLVFANQKTTKKDHSSKRLSYALAEGDHSAWDEITSVLYPPEELAKIEWLIGALVSGDSKKIQKFGVLYGPPGKGKGTIINILHGMFYEYTAVFEAKALGNANNQFAAAAFEHNPLLALQHDGDLSRIEDNTKLNSIVAHEEMLINQKHKAAYMAKIVALLIMGTNQPVKISDARSGLLRRLLDIHPSGNLVAAKQYQALMARIKFEYGAIAAHCLEVYKSMGIHYYDAYRPLEMMYKTDAFFNFVEHNFETLSEGEGITLKRAWTLYKEYADDAKLQYTLTMSRFREELKDYYRGYENRKVVRGEIVTSWFYDFDRSKFTVIKDVILENVEPDMPNLELSATESILDEYLMHEKAQYATRSETPKQKWEEVTETLKDLDTKKLHFVMVPLNHIVIDFDLTDEKGNKSLEKNLAAASLWPPTYAELSKSGTGVHLHYETDLDVSLLSSDFADGIEVKTLLGNSALRRRLTSCNNIPVAKINSGLPMKEKKVLAQKTIGTEKGLRALIGRNMRKEIHPGTKSSIDFIKKILEEAYTEGLQYDVTDLQAPLVAFAVGSTNNQFACMKMVQEMKFQGDQSKAEGSVDLADGDDLVIYDVEVYPNLFVVCFSYENSDEVVKMVNPGVSDIEKLLKLPLVGFYNRRYDNHILYAAYMGYNNLSLYNLSQAIIANKAGAMFGEAYNLSFADIWDFSSIKMSLKKWQIKLGIFHKEMDIPWDKPVPDDRIMDVVDYCVNDVVSTKAVLKDRKQDYVARQIIADLSGMSINDTTQAHTARIIFGRDRSPQTKFEYTDLSKDFPTYEYDKFARKSIYRGLDPSEGGYVHAVPGIHTNVAVLDVASMHPTSIGILNLFGDYTSKYDELLEARLAIKAGDFSSARNLLNGKLEPYLSDEKDAEALSYALKIVLNIVYGLTSASFNNAFKDNRNIDNIVAKRGALFMIDLQKHVEARGFVAAHIKTDSIKIPNATPEIIKEVMDFGKLYGYTFEHEATYDKFCLVNDAVYIARYGWAAKERLIGKWDATGAQFQHPYVYKTLFTKEKIMFNDLCEAKSVNVGAMYLDFEYDRPGEPVIESMQFVGKTGLFMPVTEEGNGAALYRVQDGKPFAVTGTKGIHWVEAGIAKKMNAGTTNMHYFENLADKARKKIEQYGSFDQFVS